VSLPPDRLPKTLADIGFVGYTQASTQFILPPVCTVAAGPFQMGSDKRRDAQAQDNESPEHQVTLPAYQIGRFPVTVAEYACFVATGHTEPRKSAYHGVDWRTQLSRLDHPVTVVTWHDATAYAAWLAERSGMPWRLPTEAEWEKAARWDQRRGVARLYPWGDRFDKARCNTSESGKGTTTPVSAYVNAGGASPCGALDMAGNVWEWTSSQYRPYPYSVSDGRDDPNSTMNRVLRGGSWDDDARSACAAYRNDDGRVRFRDFDGFRLVLG
jgi:formylglycine-generating enzyme required for sulfatase activity